MVLSLAPIIKESVTKPNVSLTQARRGKAQECFRHAGNGHISESGEGLNQAPQNPGLGWGTFLARLGAEGSSRGWDSESGGTPQGCPAWRRCQGVPAVPGLAEPGNFPIPRRIEVFLVTISHTGWER